MLKTALQELNSHSILQYDFLEKILQDRSNGETIDNDFLVLNLTLMCKLGYKKEVIFLFKKEILTNFKSYFESYSKKSRILITHSIKP